MDKMWELFLNHTRTALTCPSDSAVAYYISFTVIAMACGMAVLCASIRASILPSFMGAIASGSGIGVEGTGSIVLEAMAGRREDDILSCISEEDLATLLRLLESPYSQAALLYGADKVRVDSILAQAQQRGSLRGEVADLRALGAQHKDRLLKRLISLTNKSWSKHRTVVLVIHTGHTLDDEHLQRLHALLSELSSINSHTRSKAPIHTVITTQNALLTPPPSLRYLTRLRIRCLSKREAVHAWTSVLNESKMYTHIGEFLYRNIENAHMSSQNMDKNSVSEQLHAAADADSATASSTNGILQRNGNAHINARNPSKEKETDNASASSTSHKYQRLVDTLSEIIDAWGCDIAEIQRVLTSMYVRQCSVSALKSEEISAGLLQLMHESAPLQSKSLYKECVDDNILSDMRSNQAEVVTLVMHSEDGLLPMHTLYHTHWELVGAAVDLIATGVLGIVLSTDPRGDDMNYISGDMHDHHQSNDAAENDDVVIAAAGGGLITPSKSVSRTASHMSQRLGDSKMDRGADTNGGFGASPSASDMTTAPASASSSVDDFSTQYLRRGLSIHTGANCVNGPNGTAKASGNGLKTVPSFDHSIDNLFGGTAYSAYSTSSTPVRTAHSELLNIHGHSHGNNHGTNQNLHHHVPLGVSLSTPPKTAQTMLAGSVGIKHRAKGEPIGTPMSVVSNSSRAHTRAVNNLTLNNALLSIAGLSSTSRDILQAQQSLTDVYISIRRPMEGMALHYLAHMNSERVEHMKATNSKLYGSRDVTRTQSMHDVYAKVGAQPHDVHPRPSRSSSSSSVFDPVGDATMMRQMIRSTQAHAHAHAHAQAQAQAQAHTHAHTHMSFHSNGNKNGKEKDGNKQGFQG